MARRYEPPIGPAPQYPERDRQVYDAVQGAETRRVWAGPRLAEEQLVQRGGLMAGFSQGTDPTRSERQYDATFASGRHSPLGDGSPATRGPVWANDPAAEAGFRQGAHGTEQSVTAKPYPYAQREGANEATITPLSALRAGERPGNTYQYKIRPENGGRGRSNPAAVFGSEDVR
jgi:hypothetical protein